MALQTTLLNGNMACVEMAIKSYLKAVVSLDWGAHPPENGGHLPC